MIVKETRRVIRLRKHVRIRKKISGTPETPRLCVFKSGRNVYAQIIDDVAGITLVATSSLDAELRKVIKNGGTIEAAAIVGADIAQKAKVKGIENIVFDRGGFMYHGKIKALADAARENGLNF